ncbi:glycosyltransferase family 2 protein [uncultured Shimia sp.]|uniref:glycosyltransferase family 2 protein n=1 Tax=uncultured Shimia sp. TaxID=573152 RepID=UPI00263999BD|nr:glycosyltransferase family 2 protein [uncultured Shimia sp.]
MKIAALTMVYRDYWALSRWYAQHTRELGAENLFVVSHGVDPKIAEICPEARIFTVLRDDLAHFDRVRGRMLDVYVTDLLQDYDWVLRTDVDEILCYDPALHDGLKDVIAKSETPVVWALGFDVVEMADAKPIDEGPALGQRRDAVFSGHYSKAVATRVSVPFRLHGVDVGTENLQEFPFHMPRGFYLAHLKFANAQALAEANAVRRAVANAEGRGLPGAAWQDPEAETQKVYDEMAVMRLKPWARAEEKAWRKLGQSPARMDRFGVVRARKYRPDFRTQLPEGFKDQG